MKTDWELIDSISNAIGRPEFDMDSVIKALQEKADEMKGRGENPGSLWAVAQILPELVETAKKRY